MRKDKDMFASQEEYAEMTKLLESWKNDPQNMKSAFVKFKDKLLNKDNTILSFISRPGVSYSLRATVKNSDEKNKPLFVMVDIIDDDPENRWLSVCFYGDMITDPEEAGDFVPQGLLGEDGHCFDLDEDDESMFSYVEERIDEAHAYMSAGK